jgi:SAM-dependent methyltransferase
MATLSQQEPTVRPAAEFDRYAEGYDGGMDNPLKRLLGSAPEDFLRVKIDWMLNDLRRRPVRSAGSALPHLLDYGCGDGLFLRVLHEQGFAGKFAGCDVSVEMLRQAVNAWADRTPPDFFLLRDENINQTARRCDIIVVCAVLHHIEPDVRAAIYRKVHGLLNPGGRVYVFEHNPYNPVTNWVVKHTPIDQNAILLRPGEVKQGLADAEFRDVGVCYQMFFPPRLRFLRGVESLLRWLPLGGQYAVWGEKA